MDAPSEPEANPPMHLRQCFALACLAIEYVRDCHTLDYATAQQALNILRGLLEIEKTREQEESPNS